MCCVLLRGQDQTGVVIDTGRQPKLKVKTIREPTRRVPLLHRADHLFAAQAAQAWSADAAQAALVYGQNTATKYVCKKKATPAYTREQIEKLAAAAIARENLSRRGSGALDRFAAGDAPAVESSDNDEEGEEEEQDIC